MFKMPEPLSRNTCDVCLIQNTNMCPHSSYFIGRVMGDASRLLNNTCHRFVITPLERDTREEEIMSKLHMNLDK